MAAKLIECLWVSQYGATAASGTVQFFQPGTLTPVNVYKDDAATQIATQPVALDADGRTVFPLYTTVPARAVISDSSGATLEDVERINGDRAALVALVNTTWPNEASVDAAFTALTATLGGSDGNFRSILTGAVDRPLRNKLADQTSVKDYGAKGDGVTDDTAAINVGLAAIQATGKPGSLLMPAGDYIISAPLSITGAGTTLRGEGRAVSRIVNTSGTGAAITISNVASVSVFDLGILNSGSSTGNGITQTALSAHYYRGLSIANHRRGISAAWGRVVDCDITTDGSGATAAAILPAAASDVDVFVCRFGSVGDRAIDGASLPTNLVIVGNTFGQTINQASITFAAGAGTTAAIIAGNRFSNTTGGCISNGSATGIIVLGNSGGGAGTVGVAFTAGDISIKQTTGVNATLTMDLTKWATHKLVGTAGGITLTFAFSGRQPREQLVTVMLQNASAGAVTMVAGANVVASTIVSPGAGLQITGNFMYDPENSKLVQIGTWSTAIANT